MAVTVVRPTPIGSPISSGLRFSSEPILAWRSWFVLPPRVKRNGNVVRAQIPAQLTSFTYAVRWTPRRKMSAHCLEAYSRVHRGRFDLRPHIAPCLDCACGVYAVKTNESCSRWGHARWDRPVIHGRVWLWGSVLEFEDGYRAEYAYPAELWVLPRGERPLHAVERNTIYEDLGMHDSDIASYLTSTYGVTARVGEPA